MKYLLTALATFLLAFPALASEDVTKVFVEFMEMAKAGDLEDAIDEYGIDERESKPLKNPLAKVKVPGELIYEVKDSKLEEDETEAVIKADIEYETIVDKTEGTINSVSTAGQALTGNAVGAAGSLARNQVESSLSSLGGAEKIDMKQEDGEWKVIVTDDLYDTLTGQK
ncbi:MAG: hypothetical protein AAGG02_12075 [Cyanobacteria bacterium P01_H01_bin.15]